MFRNVSVFRSSMILTVLAFASLYGATFAWGTSFSPQPQVWIALLLTFPLIWLSIVDLRQYVIPDSATGLVAILGLTNQWIVDPNAIPITIIVAALMLVVLWFASSVYWHRRGHEALGLGDAKLIAAGALCVGPDAFWLMILISASSGILATLLSRIRKVDNNSGVPFGPFLSYGLYLTFLLSRTV